MSVDLLKSFLLWSTVINYAVLCSISYRSSRRTPPADGMQRKRGLSLV